MGTAGPSGFLSANTPREPGGKAGQIHRLGARGFTDRREEEQRGREMGGKRESIEGKGRNRERTPRRKAPKEERPWESLLTPN